MRLPKRRQAKPGAASTTTRKRESSAPLAEIPSETLGWPRSATIAEDMGLGEATFAEPTSHVLDTGSNSCAPTQPVLSRSIQEWWGLAAPDIPDNWTDELPEHDRARLDRMRTALGLPDSRAMLVHLIRWLVIGHRTAWLSQPLGKGVDFWLANVAGR